MRGARRGEVGATGGAGGYLHPISTSPPSTPIAAPATAEILGVPLAVADYEQVMDWMDAMIAAGGRGYLTAAAVNLVMSAQEDAEARAAVLGATLAVPDGQPLVWALHALGHARATRVYGPELMARFCARAAGAGTPIYLYGGRSPEALAMLERRLRERFRGLEIVGGFSPPFRPLTAAEEERAIAEIDSSGAAVVWVGTGQPKQEKWMLHMRPRLSAPLLVGVGAAFDFHAGLVSSGPVLDAALGPRVDLPPLARAAAPVATLRPPKPSLRGRVYASVPTPPPRPSRLIFLDDFRACWRGEPRHGAANLFACMTPSQSTAEVSVIGLGRVGLPLALSFADRGLEVVGIDNDPARLGAVREGRMPFAETGAQDLLDRVRASGRLSLSERVADARAGPPDRDHAGDPLVLPHRDRHA